MAQTLTALPALSTPTTVPDSRTLVANMSALENLGRADLLTVMVLGLVHDISGTKDYRTNHPLLISDAASLFGAISLVNPSDLNRQVLLVWAVLCWNAGKVADATLTTDVAALLLEGRDLRCLPEETLLQILFMLQYRLAL